MHSSPKNPIELETILIVCPIFSEMSENLVRDSSKYISPYQVNLQIKLKQPKFQKILSFL